MDRRGTRRSLVCLAFWACFVAGCWQLDLAAQTRPPERRSLIDRSREPKFRPDRVLVRFRPTVTRDAINAAHARVGATILKEMKIVDRLQLVQIKAGASVSDTIRRYRSDPNILYAEPDYILNAFDIVPNDSQFSLVLRNFKGYMIASHSMIVLALWTSSSSSIQRSSNSVCSSQKF
jgi:hypothetical protein